MAAKGEMSREDRERLEIFKWNFKWDMRFEETAGANKALWQGWGKLGVKGPMGEKIER